MTDTELNVPALGRPCSLGQLYDAVHSQFLGAHLFHGSKTVAVEEPCPHSRFTYIEVRSLEDRAKSLNVSTSLSISLLSGLVSCGGIGSFLSRGNNSDRSNIIAAIYQCQTSHKRLDLNEMHASIALSTGQVARMRATHVVTGITYGGNAIGTFVQRGTKSASNEDGKASFGLDVFKSSLKANADGSAAQALDNYDLSISLFADFVDETMQSPINASELVQIVRVSARHIGAGVPYKIVLTPLSQFDFDNIEPLLQHLEDLDVDALLNFFDEILTLRNDQSILQSRFEIQKTFFPSLAKHLRKHAHRTETFLQGARRKLAKYVVGYRTGAIEDDVATFLGDVEPELQQELETFEADVGQVEDCLRIVEAAEMYHFPLITKSSLQTATIHSRLIYLVVVPTGCDVDDLIGLYRELDEDLLKWDALAQHTIEMSIRHCLHVDDLMQIHHKRRDNGLTVGIRHAQEHQEAVFVTFGSLKTSSSFGWSTVEKNGWGRLANDKQKWRYLGHVQDGLRHGAGMATYSDGSVYVGQWSHDQRNGYGAMYTFDGKNFTSTDVGLYLDNCFNDGVAVVTKVTLFRDKVPVDSRMVVFGRFETLSSHIKRLQTAFRWAANEEARVVFEASQSLQSRQVKIIGRHLAPSEDAASIQNEYWSMSEILSIRVMFL